MKCYNTDQILHIVIVIKTKNVRQAGHVACMGEMTEVNIKFGSESWKKQDNLKIYCISPNIMASLIFLMRKIWEGGKSFFEKMHMPFSSEGYFFILILKDLKIK